MKKYFIVDDLTTHRSICDFDALTATTEADAIREGKKVWEHLSKTDKAARDAFYIGYGKLGEDGIPSDEGWDIVYDCMTSVPGFDYAVALMDDEIREAVHADGRFDTEAAFLEEYRRRHLAKYGEEFTF